MQVDQPESLSVNFEQVTRARYEGARVEPQACRMHLARRMQAQPSQQVFIRDGEILLRQRFDRSGFVLLSAFAPELGGQHIAYAKASIHPSGYVAVRDVRVLNPDFKRRKIGHTFYNVLDEHLAPLNAKVIPSMTRIEDQGRAFWMNRDPEALALRDVFQEMQVCPEALKTFTPDHILWSRFAALERD